jgi:hypothetical protein
VATSDRARRPQIFRRPDSLRRLPLRKTTPNVKKMHDLRRERRQARDSRFDLVSRLQSFRSVNQARNPKTITAWGFRHAD